MNRSSHCKLLFFECKRMVQNAICLLDVVQFVMLVISQENDMSGVLILFGSSLTNILNNCLHLSDEF